MFRRLGLLLIFSLATAVASAQVRLQHRFASGERYETSVNAKITQKLTIGEADIDAAFEEHALIESRVGERTSDERLPITERFTAWQAELMAADQQARFDLANPEVRSGSAIDNFLDPQRVLAKTPRTVLLDGNERVVGLEGYSALSEGLGKQSQQQNAALLSEEYHRSAIAADLDRIPTSDIRPGDTWKRTEEHAFYGNQSLTLERTYRYRGIVEQDDRQLDDIEVQISAAAYQLGAGGGEILITADRTMLTVASSTGQLLFDCERGRIVRSIEKTRLHGDIKLAIGQTTVPSRVELVYEADRTLLP